MAETMESPDMPQRKRLSNPELFWRHVAIHPSGCWLWTATVAGGYGQVSRWMDGRSRKYQAHRVAYELTIGPIPDGLTIDHLCRTKLCVNPFHMEPVTHKVNNLRGGSVAAIHARKTHCVNGHEFTPENTYVRRTPTGTSRQCRQCCRDRDQSRASGWARGKRAA